MSLSSLFILGLVCLVCPALSDSTSVAEDGAAIGREAKLLDLSKVTSNSKLADLFDFSSKDTDSDASRGDSARARFFNVVKKSSLSPYEMLIDCLILVIPEKIETLQELCDNLQILLDLRNRENDIDFDALATALMNAITQYLNAEAQQIRNLQAIAGMGATTTAPPARRRRPSAATRRRNEIHQMLRQMLRNQQEQLRMSQQRQAKDIENPTAKN